MKKILLYLFFSVSFIGLHAQDECSSAIAITPAITNCIPQVIDMTGSTLSDNSDTCTDTYFSMSEPPVGDVWFTFEATELPVWLQAGYWILYSGTCDNLSVVTCFVEHEQDEPLILSSGENYFIRCYFANPSNNYTNVCLGPNHQGIAIDDNQYTPEELVNEVLFGSVCGTISNITSVSSTDTDAKSIGNFERNGAYFPFESGIVLSTRNISGIGSPGSSSWIGDEDLSDLIPNDITYNASALEFDFTALAHTISFECLFASNEYNEATQCDFIDAFAIFLTDLESGETVNIALVPGTNLPITTQNIRNSFGQFCPAANLIYYSSQTYAGLANYSGKTIPLTATGIIIPDHNYHVKIVIADGWDNARDSSVFIKSASFGIDIPDAIAITDNNYGRVCSNGSTDLTVNIDDNFNVQWSHNGVAIDGATSHTYNATEGGSYSANVIYPGADESCGGIFEHTLIYLDVNPELSAITAEDTNNDGVAQFDLNAIIEQIIEDNEFGDFIEAGFYLTGAQAEEALSEDNLNYFGPYTNISNPQTLYLRIEGFDNDCFSVTPVQFTVLVDEVPAPTGETLQVFMEGATIADLVVAGNDIQWYSDAAGENLLPLATVLTDDTTYYASQTIGGLESVTYLAVSVNIIVPTPAPTGETIQYFLENSTLADLVANGENIKWYAASEGGEPLSMSTLLINNTMYFASQTVDGLESEQRLTVTAFVTSPPPVGEPEQTLTEGATLADIDMEGEDIQWYDTPGAIVPGPPNNNDIPLPLTTVLVDGETYYASQTIDGLESAFRTAVTITLAPVPTIEAPTGLTEQSFTEGETLADLDVIGENIKWYATTESEEVLSMTTTLIDNTTYYATQTVNNIESAERLGVTANLILGIGNVAFNNFHFYPNPVKDLLTIVNGQEIAGITVSNMLGQQVLTTELNASVVLVDFSTLSSGMYLVEVRSGSNAKTFKIVKQ